MRSDTLAGILNTADRFDLRNPEMLMQVSAEGSLELASFLFGLVKRPAPRIRQLIREAETRATGRWEQGPEIKKIDKPSEVEVIRLIDRSQPFLITGVLDDWPFLSADFRKLKEDYGSLNLRPDLEKGNGEFETLGDFIENMNDPGNKEVYTFGCPLPLAIWAELPLPYFDWDSLTSPQIWMGRKTGDRPCTTLHRDCNHGLLVNLLGRKKMIFFSPDQSDYVYPVPAFNTYQPCEIGDVLHVDLQQYPLFGNACPFEVIVEPGEILVIPAFWYHCVYALEDVLSISFSILWDAWQNWQSEILSSQSKN